MAEFFMLIVHIEAAIGRGDPYCIAIKEENNKVFFGKYANGLITDQVALDASPGADLCERLYQALMDYYHNTIKPTATYTDGKWHYYLTNENVSILFPQNNANWIKDRISQDENMGFGSR